MASAYVALPWITLLMLFLQGLSISLITDVSIQALTPPRWQFADSIARLSTPGETNASELILHSYHNGVYQFLGFISDVKQLVPFFAVLLWAYFSRRYFATCMKIVPSGRLLALVIAHLAFALVVLMTLTYFLFSNENGNIVGETRFGLLSVWQWLSEGGLYRPSIFSILMIFVYRATYIGFMIISCFAASFPAMILVFSISTHLGSRAGTRSDGLDKDRLLSKSARRRLGPATPGRSNQKWLIEYLKLLLGLLAFVACAYFLLWHHQHYDASQFLKVALPISCILLAFVIVPLVMIMRSRNITVFGGLIYWIYLALLVMAPFFADSIFREGAKVAYAATHDDRDDARDGRSLEFVSRVCTSMASSHFESASVMDATRRFWESLRSREINSIDCDYLVCLVWSARLTKLERLYRDTLGWDAIDSPLDTVLKLSQTAVNQATYAWEPASDCGHLISQKWPKRVLRHVKNAIRTAETVYGGSVDSLFTPRLVVDVSTGKALSVEDQKNIIRVYLDRTVGSVMSAPPAKREGVGGVIEDYLYRIDIDAVAQSNYRYIIGLTRGN
ncbi:MAG TPA: hypothetical protein VN285_11775 [Candidatus Deferrimicrobium sp.]|nr:hypothetical protein [Candidatus Deferrimicrobium sp.]